MAAMSEAVFNRTPVWRFVFSLLRGIDIPLLLGTLALLAISLTAMYSSAYDFAGRFNIHTRNIALAKNATKHPPPANGTTHKTAPPTAN